MFLHNRAAGKLAKGLILALPARLAEDLLPTTEKSN